MVFNSLEFALFLPVVLAAYWSVKRRSQNVILLAASWLFYALFDWRFLALLLLSTVLDYRFGLALGKAHDKGRLRWLVASLVVNLGILAIFKYFDFFGESAKDLLQVMGIDAHLPVLGVALPIGISFYTFHGIGYVFDVYRRDIEPTRSLLDYACFVAYFPQLVAGPIGRSTIQLPQIEQQRSRPRRETIGDAAALILVGLVKKVVIADGVAGVANEVFAGANSASAATLVLGMYAFALQIYGDFSGYSDIARGTSRLFGIELPHNFTEPYLSRNITEFWRRWHISLSCWLRDYLYVPLGGNRGSSLATYRNLMLVMLLGGLWHGASWNFVVWGGAHGLALVVHRGWTRHRGRSDDARGFDLLRRLATFHLVALLWIPFRAATFDSTWDFVRGLVSVRPGGISAAAALTVGLAALGAFAIDLTARRIRAEGRAWLVQRPLVSEIALAASGLAVVIYSGGAPVPFIYFRF